MIIKSVEGDNVNILATRAMEATLLALAAEGKLSNEDMNRFVETHVCVLAEDGIFERILKKFFGAPEKSGGRCLILKVVISEDAQR